MENNPFMFETTSQRCMIIARIGQIGHQNAQIVGPQTRSASYSEVRKVRIRGTLTNLWLAVIGASAVERTKKIKKCHDMSRAGFFCI